VGCAPDGEPVNILNVGPIEKLTRRDEEAPEYTRHVWYDVENGRLVATNGHALVIAAVEPETGDVTGPITIQAIHYARGCTKLGNGSSVICEQKQFRFADGAIGIRPQGEFPDYEAIVPKIAGPPTITFNPELLAQIVAAFPKQELGKKGVNPGSISLWVVPDADPAKPSPIVVKAHYDGGLAVLMPVSGMDPSKWNTELPRGIR
jgi:hypothetical protein